MYSTTFLLIILKWSRAHVILLFLQDGCICNIHVNFTEVEEYI